MALCAQVHHNRCVLFATFLSWYLCSTLFHEYSCPTGACWCVGNCLHGMLCNTQVMPPLASLHCSSD